ncbi:MAG: hypothetical protein HQ541_01165, partial [Mariniphaga sp.]|nr:hypothetical protein [Mariniphaga sp.]
MKKSIVFFLFLMAIAFSCNLSHEAKNTDTGPSFEQALKNWPEMPQNVTFIGMKNCLTKFQVYWNGALSCFTGRDCFGNIFPPQLELSQQFENDQLHMTFGYGKLPKFQVVDTNQVSQSLLNGYLPITKTSWQSRNSDYSIQSLACPLNPLEWKTDSPAQALCMSRILVKPNENQDEINLWLNFSGYKILVPTDKEKVDDTFPVYGSELNLVGLTLFDNNGNIRATFNTLPGTKLVFHKKYKMDEIENPEFLLAEKKGFLKNLLQITIPCKPGEEVVLDIALPYFPIDIKNAVFLERNFSIELEKVVEYWEDQYANDVQIETPEPFVNNFYKAGLHHAFITADKDAATGNIYAKSSPAWYETIWPNCAMVTINSLDLRGFHDEARSYLEPFLDWQSVRSPPGMDNNYKAGFFCPPEEFTAIPWVSNHGNTLWAICEHYRITKDIEWKERIINPVIEACEWIINQRSRTMDQDYGNGLLPGGTVSDDKGSGQYLCSDAQNYRGLRSAADFLIATGHERAVEMDMAAKGYKEDIREAVWAAVERNDSVTLINGEKIPFVPAEINQTEPPEFDKTDFWPYINYIDVGPMHMADCGVFESDNDIIKWILQFENQYTVANLQNEISLTENWVHSIKNEGDTPAHLLLNGVSTVEPFYAPRTAAFIANDDVDRYLEVFYNQLASAVSHRTLTPIENRYGVWNMPWADGEFHKMLLRMLVYEQDKNLVLMKAIPRRWLENGKQIQIKNQPTSFGKLSYSVSSQIEKGYIKMTLEPPKRTLPENLIIRFRHPEKKTIKKVLINEK